MKSLAYLNKYLWKYKWRLFLGIIFVTLSNVFGVYMPQLVGDAVDIISTSISELSNDEISQSELISTIINSSIILALVYMGLALIKGVFVFLNRQTIIIMSRLIEYDLKNEIFAHYQKLDVAFFKRNKVGDLMNRISEDVSKVRMYLGPAIMYTINLLVLIFLTVGFMLNTDVELTLYALAPLPVMAVLIYYVSSVINLKSEKVQKDQSKLSTFVQESFSGIRVIKAYNKQKLFNQGFENSNDNYREANLSLAKTNSLFFPIMLLLIGLSTILTIYIGGLKAINDEGITPGDLATFVIYVNMLTWPFASVGWVSSLTQRAAASQARINEFLNQEPTVLNEVTENTEITPNIAFKNVNFYYPDSGIQALKNVSFEISKGETLGIIGETGSGKSTIPALISRLYDSSSGDVLIGGEKIRKLNLDNLRDSIGYVPQDVFLFSDSIKENISFGLKHDVSIEEIKKAAKNAHILHNIEEFKDGFDTILGERGITLSGGQKQRVSIARAIIKDPKILIFDDCLSAVDTETEEAILSNLKRVAKNKSTIIIGHRISSILHADKIIVLKEGEIVETGNHDELMGLKGTYYSLYQNQLTEKTE